MIVLSALILNAALLERAWAAQVCAWIVESVEDDGTHKFDLNLSADAPTSVSVRFQGPGFLSAAMGGDMIQLTPGEPKDIDDEGFDVSAGDALMFDVRLYDHPLESLEELRSAAGTPLAGFGFHGKAGADGRAPPAVLTKQCRTLG
ncbi:MAG TPA: hypothetical protein VKQ70_16660 [Caulobacteraceae bacterium]|nr:hypothetical protein [Caulobacteraceae bacterium]